MSSTSTNSPWNVTRSIASSERVTSTVSRIACTGRCRSMPTFVASGSHHAPIPSLMRPGARSSERRERRGEEPDVARPVVHDARADPDPLRHRRERGHRHGRLADESALGLPDGLEAALLGELRVAHAVADRVLVLEVETYPVVNGDGHLAPPSARIRVARSRRGASRAGRPRRGRARPPPPRPRASAAGRGRPTPRRP